MARKSGMSKRAVVKASCHRGSRCREAQHNNEPAYRRSKASNEASNVRRLLRAAAREAAQYEHARDARLLLSKKHCTDRPYKADPETLLTIPNAES